MSKRKCSKEQLIDAVKKSKSYREVCRILGYKSGASVIARYVEELSLDTSHFTTSTKKGETKYNNLLNVKRNKLTVIEIIPPKYDQPRHWDNVYKVVCKCDCGKYRTYQARYFNKSLSISCGCDKSYYEKTSGKHSPKFTGYKEISGTYWKRLKNRNKQVDITIEQAWNVYEKQSRRCALSGLLITFSKKTKGTDGTASLDRIDSSKGYTIDNVQWVHKDINRMKSNFNERYFIEICRKVSDANPVY
jgi:hypothetical protein